MPQNTLTEHIPGFECSVTTAVTSGIAAPCASFTVPEIEPPTAWAVARLVAPRQQYRLIMPKDVTHGQNLRDDGRTMRARKKTERLMQTRIIGFLPRVHRLGQLWQLRECAQEYVPCAGTAS